MKKILYFTAPWCKACISLEPHLERARRLVEVETIDVSTAGAVAEAHQVNGLPCLIMLEDGREVKRTNGMSQDTTNTLYTFLGIL